MGKIQEEFKKAVQASIDGVPWRLGTSYHGLKMLSPRVKGEKLKTGKAADNQLARRLHQTSGLEGVSNLGLLRWLLPLRAQDSYPAECGGCGLGGPGCDLCARGGEHGLLLHRLVWVQGVLVDRSTIFPWLHDFPSWIKLSPRLVSFPRQHGLSPVERLCLLLDAHPYKVLVPGLPEEWAYPHTPRWSKQLALFGDVEPPAPSPVEPREAVNDNELGTPGHQPNLEGL
jgi:hypothetical protein